MRNGAFLIIIFGILVIMFPDLVGILIGGLFVLIGINILIATGFMSGFGKGQNQGTSGPSKAKKEYKFLNYTIYKDK